MSRQARGKVLGPCGGVARGLTQNVRTVQAIERQQQRMIRDYLATYQPAPVLRVIAQRWTAPTALSTLRLSGRWRTAAARAAQR